MNKEWNVKIQGRDVTIYYIDDKNDLTEVCIGTGKKNSKQYYMDRPRIAGDYHGQAPILWCAYALLNNK